MAAEPAQPAEPSQPATTKNGRHEDGTAAPESSEGLKIYLTTPGDLLVRVDRNESTKTFVVSSASMCLASRVWRAMLASSSQFKEASESEVHFPEDDASSLLLILRIVHFQFHMVPQVIPFDDLYKISLLCDKYDVVNLVRPWSSQWIKNAKDTVTEDSHKGPWLSIAWVFGDQEMFQRLVRTLALKCTISASSEEPFLSDDNLASDNIIPSLDFAVVHARAIILDALLDVCRNLIQDFAMVPETVCENSEVSVENRRSCDAQGIGYLIRGLGQLGLWPLPETSFVTDVNLEDISSMFSSIHFDIFYHKYWMKGRSGENCNKLGTQFKVSVKRIINEHAAALIDAHQRHFNELTANNLPS